MLREYANDRMIFIVCVSLLLSLFIGGVTLFIASSGCESLAWVSRIVLHAISVLFLRASGFLCDGYCVSLSPFFPFHYLHFFFYFFVSLSLCLPLLPDPPPPPVCLFVIYVCLFISLSVLVNTQT